MCISRLERVWDAVLNHLLAITTAHKASLNIFSELSQKPGDTTLKTHQESKNTQDFVLHKDVQAVAGSRNLSLFTHLHILNQELTA